MSHLAPFVETSRKKIQCELIKEWKENNFKFSEEGLEETTNKRLEKEIKDGIQTFNYQLNTLQTSSGQSPFTSVMMYISELKEYEKDTALLIKEVLNQRLQGIKNEVGVYTTYEFPKLLYVLDENNIHEGSEYYELTQLSAQCTAKRLIPDYLSAKKLKENYEGQIVPPINKTVA